MEDKNGWKCLDLYPLARLARVRFANLYRLRDQCVLNAVYRVRLREEFDF